MQKETIENYCKTILFLDKGDSVKSVDIARELGISKISVSITLHKLREENYVEMRRYGKVHLTEKGKTVARKISTKHRAIRDFLQDRLEIERDRAMIEACAIEHHLSDNTMKKLTSFCKKLDKK